LNSAGYQERILPFILILSIVLTFNKKRPQIATLIELKPAKLTKTGSGYKQKVIEKNLFKMLILASSLGG